MKKLKQVILVFDDGSFKGYNRKAFKKVMAIKWEEYFGGEE